MIAQLDRKATFENPIAIVSASGGTTNSFTKWGELWCKLEQDSGSKSYNGSQDNLVKSIRLTVRYSSTVTTYLNKDTRVTVGGITYQITDYNADHRKEFVEIKATGRLPGTTSENSSPMTGYLHTVTVGGGTSFTLANLRNREIVSIESGRAIPMDVITTGTPAADQILYTKATGTFTVSSDAPLVAGEKFKILYK